MADFDVEHKDLVQLIVRKKMKPLRNRIRALCFIDHKGLYKQIFTNEQLLTGDIPANWPDICQMTQKSLEEDKIGRRYPS